MAAFTDGALHWLHALVDLVISSYAKLARFLVRRTRWAPEMFPNVPTDARIENQRVTIPSFRLQDILGDAASVHERVLGHIWPAVQRQLRENMSKIVTLENVGAWYGCILALHACVLESSLGLTDLCGCLLLQARTTDGRLG